MENWFFASKSFIKITLYTKQVHFQMWSVVKLFFRNPTRSKIYCSKVPFLKKNAPSLTHLKFLIQYMTRCTKNYSKTDYFQKVWSNFFFWMKTIFFATTFPRMHTKDNIDVFTLYIEQLNCSLRASFPKNLDFLTTLFSSKTDAL